MSPTPATTHALVVGIERYAAGDGWDLVGPVENALEFVAWLKSRGIEDANVHLFLAPRPGEVPDVPHGKPTRAAIEHFLAETLRTLDGELLVVYWDGHGVLGTGPSRRVYYADATENNRVNLDLARLARFLNSSGIGALRQHLVIVDACANFSDSMGTPAETPDGGPATIPPGGGGADVRQHWLYSTSVGEYSANAETIETPFKFFPQLMKLMRDETAGWPVDLEELLPRVRAQFEDLHARGLAAQSPVYMSVEIAGDPRFVRLGVPATIEARRAAERIGWAELHLRSLATRFARSTALEDRAGRDDLLERLDLPAPAPIRTDDPDEDVRRILTACLRTRSLQDALDAMSDVDPALIDELTSFAANLEAIGVVRPLLLEAQITRAQVRRAEGFYDAPNVPPPEGLDQALDLFADRGPAALFEFVVRATQLAAPDRRAPLEAWAQEHPTSALTLADLKAQIAAERAPGRPTVLIDGVPSERDGREEVMWYLSCSPSKWRAHVTPMDDAGWQRTLRRILDEAGRENDVELEPLVQLALPRERFADSPHLWPVDDGEWGDPLEAGQQFQFVLRWRDRIFRSDMGPVALAWRAKMQRIRQRIESAVAPCLAPLVATDRDTALRKKVQDLDSDCFVVLVARSTDVHLQDDVVLQALRFGAPYVIWLDEHVTDLAPVEAWAGQLLDDARLDLLPERVRKLREDGALPFANSVNLVWDESDVSPVQRRTQPPR